MENSYLHLRMNMLTYTNTEMNLKLQQDNQVYIAVVDIPTYSGIIGNEYMTLAMIFGLNCHLYFSNGNVNVGLEKKPKTMSAMQSLFISSNQALSSMMLTELIDFKPSTGRRVFLKAKKGVYFKELDDGKVSIFLNMLINNVLRSIGE